MQPKRWALATRDLFASAIKGFLKDDAFTQAAALAYFTALSFAPLIVILLAIVGLLGERSKQEFIDQVVGLLGSSARPLVSDVVESAQSRPNTAWTSALIGIASLLFSATGVFVQLQNAMNVVWNVVARPGQGLWNWIRRRLLGAAMVFGSGFLLLVSLAVSTALQFLLRGEGAVWMVVNFLISIAVFAVLFAGIFKYLPDVKISWRDSFVGALITAALFAGGKLAISRYLGMSKFAGAYGAAGSLLVLLVWVYYSAAIVLFGAELAQAYASRFGRGIVPDRHARWAEDPEVHAEEREPGQDRQPRPARSA
jgi:membrane protein